MNVFDTSWSSSKVKAIGQSSRHRRIKVLLKIKFTGRLSRLMWFIAVD